MRAGNSIVGLAGASLLTLMFWEASSRHLPGSELVDLGVTFEVDGRARDMHIQSHASGLNFQVHLQEIEYRGRVNRVLLEYRTADRMTVWISLRDLNVTINRTNIRGRRRSAACGPLTVVMGTRDEVWVAFDVRRDMKSDEAKLVVDRTRFGFAQDNWTIGMPAWVRASGLGMTHTRVVSALRSGMANRRQAFEREIRQVAPPMFARVTDHVQRHLRQRLVGLK